MRSSLAVHVFFILHFFIFSNFSFSRFFTFFQFCSLTGFLLSIVPKSFSRVHEAFVCCFISSHKHSSRIAHHSDQLTNYCKLPTIPRNSLHSCMSRSTSSSAYVWRIHLHLASVLVCNSSAPCCATHHSQVFCVGCDLSLVIVQDSLTLEVFVFHAHFVHCSRI